MSDTKTSQPFTLAEKPTVEELASNNTTWRTKLSSSLPGLFDSLGKGQQPPILWIGCSDSRVPETTLLGAVPGEVFSIRNIANYVDPTEKGFMAGVEYSVGVVGVNVIIVCGHTSCGGIAASLDSSPSINKADLPKLPENVANYIKPLVELAEVHAHDLTEITDKKARGDKFSELNVLQGVTKLKELEVVKSAVESRGLQVLGAVYDVGSGELKFLKD
jgi:carbonic anhydrase